MSKKKPAEEKETLEPAPEAVVEVTPEVKEEVTPDASGAETLVLPREEAPAPTPDPEPEKATTPDPEAPVTPKEVLEEQNPGHFSRVSKRTAS